jgi:hypothetical protein
VGEEGRRFPGSDLGLVSWHRGLGRGEVNMHQLRMSASMSASEGPALDASDVERSNPMWPARIPRLFGARSGFGECKKPEKMERADLGHGITLKSILPELVFCLIGG